MKFHRKRNWFLRRMILGFTVAAAFAPAAQARVDVDGGGGANYSSSWYLGQGHLANITAEPSLAELLFDADKAIAALGDASSASLSLDRKADVFTPQPTASSGSEISWREIGAGAGLGIVLAACGAALAVAMSRRRPTIAGT